MLTTGGATDRPGGNLSELWTPKTVFGLQRGEEEVRHSSTLTRTRSRMGTPGLNGLTGNLQRRYALPNLMSGQPTNHQPVYTMVTLRTLSPYAIQTVQR